TVAGGARCSPRAAALPVSAVRTGSPTEAARHIMMRTMTREGLITEEMPPAVPGVIVGAGVIGLNLAFELAKRKVRVLVVARDRVGAGATGVAAGMLAPSSEAEYESLDLARFALDSLARYPEFVQAIERTSGLTCGYRQDGTLLVAPTRDDEEELGRLRR